MSDFCIRRLTSGGIIVNYLCSSRCGHCLYRSSPKRERGYMTPQRLRPMLQHVRALGCHSMHIGGGEPLLDPDALFAVLDTMRDYGVSLDYLETNASWHRDDASTRSLLRCLAEHGCDTVMLSVDPFHNEYIPLAKVTAVAEACRDVGMGLFIWKSDYLHEVGQLDPTKKHSLSEYEQHFGQRFIQEIPRRYGLNMNGRAIDTFRHVLSGKLVDRILSDSPRPCAEMSQTGHFHIDLHGNYVLTACVGLSIACEDLGRPLPPGEYPILDLLVAQGLPGLYHHATANHGFSPRSRYLNKCDLCQDIRRHLVMQREVESPDLQPVGFYAECDD